MEVGGCEQRVGGGGDVYFQLHSCAISLGAEILEKTAGGGEWGLTKKENRRVLAGKRAKEEERSHPPQPRAEILLLLLPVLKIQQNPGYWSDIAESVTAMYNGNKAT